MAKETISYNEIPDLNEDWSLDKRNGLPYSGLSVQNFVRSQIRSVTNSLGGKYGSVVYEGGKINFLDEAGGSVLDSITITGTSYIVSVDSNMPSAFAVLTSETSKVITLTPKTESMEFGSATKEDFPEDYTFKVEIDNGGGFVDKTPSVNTIKSGASVDIEIRNNITTGINRIRIIVTGVESRQPKTLVYTATVTSLSLSCDHPWYQIWSEGETYVISGIYFSGNIQKTLHVKVGENEYLQDYAANTQYANVPTTFDLTNYTPTDSGVVPVELWMTGEGVETQHIRYQIMYVKRADVGNISLICFNNVPSKVYNFKQEDLVQYAVYNVSNVTTTITASYGGQEKILIETTEDVVAQNIYTLSLNLQIDTDLQSGISLRVDMQSERASASAEIAVDNSNAFLAVPEAKFYLNTSLGSNATSDRDRIMNSAPVSEGFQATYEAEWTDFTFSKDAWDYDPYGNRALVVKAGSRLKIPTLKPLRNTPTMSVTFEFMFMSYAVADYDTPIFTCIDTETYDKNTSTGVIVFPTKILLLSKESRKEVFQQLPVGEDRIHHICLVFQKQYGGRGLNLFRLFINGCENVTFSYQDTDTFFTNAASTTYGGITIGQDSTDTYLYMMRIYNKAFDGTNAKDNYLNALIETAERSRAGIKEDNNILDGNSVDYYLVKKAGFNRFIVETDNPLPSLTNPVSYSKGVNIHMEYNDTPEDNVSIYDAPLDRQGTTSNLYEWANLRSKIKNALRWVYPNKKDEDGNMLEETGKNGYLFGYGARPKVQKITWKKNIASQPQGHKMGATALYNDLFKKVFGAEKLVTEGILPSIDTRVATEQKPFIGFQKFSDGTYKFIGMYTGGPDKTDKKTFGYDRTDIYPKLMLIEGPNHDPYMTRFLVPWTEDVFYDYQNETLSVGASTPSEGNKQEGWDADIAAGYGTDKQADAEAIFGLFTSEFKPAYDAVYYCSPYIASLEEALAQSGYTSLEDINNNLAAYQKKETNGHSNVLMTLYDSQYRLIYYRVKTGKYEVLPLSTHNMLTYLGLSGTPTTAEILEARRQKWISAEGVAGFVNLPEGYFHDVFCEFLGVSDNDTKNTYWRKFKSLIDGGKWGFNQDDLDTLVQNDNNGQDTKEYYVEPNDTLNGNDIFQGRTSAFWYAMRLWRNDNIKAMAHEFVDAAILLAEELNVKETTIHGRVFGLVDYYMWSHSSKYFPQAIYNADTQLAYIDVWFKDPERTYNNVPPLTQIHGDHYETERAWMEKRIAYFFSKFQLGAFEASSADGYGTLEFTPQSGYDMKVTPAIWLYPRISIGGSETEQSVRTKAGEQCTFTLPSSGTTGVYIKGLDWLSDLGDLSGLQLTSRGGSDVISFSVQGKRLRRLKVGDASGDVTFNATTLSVTGTALEEIDAQNAVTIQGTIDLKNCPRLRKILLGGTSLTSVFPPVGGRVKTLQLPDTLATLFMHSLNLLTSDNIQLSTQAMANLTTIYINSCDNINAFEILKNIYNTEGNQLKNIGVIWKGVIEDNDPNNLVMLGEIAKSVGTDNGYRGATYNENGDVVVQTIPNIAGTLHVNYNVYESDVQAIKDSKIPIVLNYDPAKVYIPFEDAEVKRVIANVWGDGFGVKQAKLDTITTFGTQFKGNTTIVKFNELGTNFPNTTKLSDGGFQGCKALEQITLPSGVTSINTNEFYGCSSLVNVGGTEQITTLKSSCFESAGNGETEVSFPNLTTLNGYKHFRYAKIKKILDMGSVVKTIPSTGSNTQYFAFQSSLEYIKLPTSLETIEEGAFSQCTRLKTVVFPSTIKTIGANAFKQCNLSECGDIHLPNCTSIGNAAFKNVTGPYAIKELGYDCVINASAGDTYYTFNGGITEINLDNVKIVGDYCFYECTSLQSIGSGTMSRMVSIGERAFWSCSKLAQEISLPMCTSIGPGAFRGTKINKVNSFGTDCVINSTNNNTNLTFGETPIEYANLSNVKSIGGNCFYQCTSLTDIVSLERATSIGEAAFNGCTALDIPELYMPNLTTIGANAFNGVKVRKINGFGKMTSVAMQNGSDSRWGSKTYLTEVVLNDELVTIGSNAFYGYSKITSIHPQGSIKTFDLGNVTKISNDAFLDCRGLTETPDLTKITSLGDRAFESCNNVDFGDLIIPNLTGIGLRAFNCSKGPRRILDLGSITTLRANNGTNSSGTFVNNSNLTLAILPSTLTTMGTSWQPFVRCAKLSVMIIRAETPPSLGSKFALGQHVSSSLKIYVPDASVAAYKSATNWASHASIIFPITQLETDNAELYEEILIYIGGGELVFDRTTIKQTDTSTNCVAISINKSVEYENTSRYSSHVDITYMGKQVEPSSVRVVSGEAEVRKTNDGVWVIYMPSYDNCIDKSGTFKSTIEFRYGAIVTQQEFTFVADTVLE